MHNFMTIPEHINDRVAFAIEFAWNITVGKIANGEIKINKEASLQMQYGAILRTVFDLIKFSPKDRVEIELETTVIIEKKKYHIDILLTYTDGIVSKKHSIELKYYNTIASSGEKRGANDIFKCGVYRDIFYSELYVQHECADHATCLILTDYSSFVDPKSKKGKSWEAYDISQGHSFVGGEFKTDTGGKKMDFKLSKAYRFDWQKIGDYWTTLLRPQQTLDNNR